MMNIRHTLANARSGSRKRTGQGVDTFLARIGLQRTGWGALVPTLAVFGSGLAVGVLVGVAFAPKRGEETRHDVRDRLVDIKDRVVDMKDRGVERYEEIVQRAKEKAEAIQEDQTNQPPAQLEHFDNADDESDEEHETTDEMHKIDRGHQSAW